MNHLMTPGQTLDGRFLLLEEIGRGGMATVFKAQDLQSGNEVVAVKIPSQMFSSGIGSWSMCQREEEIGRQLDHPLLLRFSSLPPNRRRTYLVTEFVGGRTLADRMREEHPLSESQALGIAAQVCAALEYLHGLGVVHYDVKPANVMLCPDGSIRLIDFGLAHATVDTRFSWGGGAAPAIASADYAAPEQIRRQRGRKSVDIYGVGAMLYQMLAGRPPFPGDDPFVVASARTLGDPPAPRALNPRISKQAEEITLRALRRDPSERYQSAAAMRTDAERPQEVAISGLCDHLHPVTPARRAWRLARHVALVGVVPVATQVVLFFLIWRHLARHP